MTVCAKCNDTHRVWSAARENWEPCTSCPHPCPKCNNAGTGYCKEQPCSCSCHVDDGSGRRDRYQPAAADLAAYIRAAHRQEFGEDDGVSPVADLVRHAYVTLAQQNAKVRKLQKLLRYIRNQLDDHDRQERPMCQAIEEGLKP